MVRKDDWKTVEIPSQIEEFVLEKKLTSDDIRQIEEGRRPEEMEDKWFMYYENNKLFIHRSWTGYCMLLIFQKIICCAVSCQRQLSKVGGIFGVSMFSTEVGAFSS